MKKVLFLIGSLGGGGAEKVLVETANYLVSLGFDITVETIFDEGIHKVELDSNIKYKSIVKTKNIILRKIYSILVLHFLPASFLYKRYVSDDFDYEIAFLEGMPTKIISYSNRKSIKISWVHINFLNNFESIKYFNNINQCRRCYSKFDRIVCVSDVVKNGFKSKIGLDYPLVVLYNLLDENKIISKSRETNNIYPLNKHVKIVTVGRLVYQKGYDRLIRIADRLSKAGLKFSIYIIGDGPERRKLEALVNNLGLMDYVYFLGYKENPYPYILNADLFVCSSREEGYSTVVTESLILGVPVITTDCAGMKELFGNEECGIILENSEDSLYNGLYYVLSNYNVIKYYRSNAKQRGNYFRIEQRKKELICFFNDLGDDNSV